MVRALLSAVIAIVVLIVLIWLGLRVRPRPFAVYPDAEQEVSKVPLPVDLPAPVTRYFQATYCPEADPGDCLVPEITSAVITGRARLRIAGITFPSRFRFTHIAGQGYRHYIEATLFGIPLMVVNERYLDGVSLMELPFGTVENEPKVNQAANLGLWGESLWLPAILLTDPRVRWQPVDGETAILTVPFEEGNERFVARFDPHTGLLSQLEVMRYKNEESTAKTLWILESVVWDRVGGYFVPRTASATWFDEGTPWAIFEVEEIIYNANVDAYIRAKGRLPEARSR